MRERDKKPEEERKKFDEEEQSLYLFFNFKMDLKWGEESEEDPDETQYRVIVKDLRLSYHPINVDESLEDLSFQTTPELSDHHRYK